MSTADRKEYSIKCKCGHTGLVIRETDDSGYAKRYYEDWSIDGFECVRPSFFSGIKLTAADALKECKPFCPKCNSKEIFLT